MFPIQDVGAIPWSLAERAYQRYSQLYGTGQSLERLAERGGFGLAELGYLLRGHGRNYATREILNAMRGSEARQCADELEAEIKRLMSDCPIMTRAAAEALLPLIVKWRKQAVEVTDITDQEHKEE
jgi:hypothetical protein